MGAAMTVVNDVNARILKAMSGAERVRMLLREAGFKTLTDFAFAVSTPAQTVSAQTISYCITGDRPYPEIRDELAKHLNLDRTEIDRLIDGAPAPAAEVA
jgi:hypothetical protein